MELPDHGQPAAPLLDRDRGMRGRRIRQPSDDGLPVRRRLEVPVGRPARLGRGRPGHDGDAATTSTTRGSGAGSRRYGNPALVRATSATRDYQPRSRTPGRTSGLQPGQRSDPVGKPAANDIEAATVTLFVGHNVMHDFSYYLGFDEGHWNAQQYNNGVTTSTRRRCRAVRRPAARPTTA